MIDFWDEIDEPAPASAPKESKDNPEDLEMAAGLMAVMDLLKHAMGNGQAGAERSAAAAKVLPRFWLTLAQTTATWAIPQTPGAPPDPELNRIVVDQTENWLTRVLRSGPFDYQMLQGVANVLFDLHDLPGVEDEKFSRIERSCGLLGVAIRLAPGRSDLLYELGTFLGAKAEAGPPEAREALLREAVGRFEEAARCFGPDTRRCVETGHLHPWYCRAVCAAGIYLSVLARESEDDEESFRLLRQAHRKLALADLDLPHVRSIRARAALDLAWRPGRPSARRKLFEEAGRVFSAAIDAGDPEIAAAYAHWGSATLGRAAVARSEKELRQHVERAAELFEKAKAESERAGDVDLIAAEAWLQLADESAAEMEQEAAGRAAKAARRANRATQGSGDYNLACALSRLRKPADASKALLAALAREPELAAEAIRDPDFEPLWEERPKLRRVIAAQAESRPGISPTS